MNSQQIDYFLSAAGHLSFTKAAEDFYTSQPTVSRQIALLEEELGFPLFYREGKQLRLTPGGAVMLSEFAQQRASIRSAVQRVEQIRSGLEGSLNIGFLSSFDTDYYIYPPTLAFAAQYPKVTITMDSGSFSFLRHRLYSGEYDLIFTYDFEIPYMPNVLSQHAYRTGCSLISSASHPLADRKHLTAANLRGQTLILPTPIDSEGRISDMLALLSRGFGATSDDLAQIRIRGVDTLETKQFLVRSGQGLGITGNCMIYAYDSRYALYPIPGESINVVAAWHKDNLNPAVPLFLQTISHIPEIDVFTNRIHQM